jgi:predicted Holliday junction resolvase-like endonuclease
MTTTTIINMIVTILITIILVLLKNLYLLILLFDEIHHRIRLTHRQDRILNSFQTNNNQHNRQQHANNITTTSTLDSSDSTEPSLTSEFDTQGDQTEHEASAHPRF